MWGNKYASVVQIPQKYSNEVQHSLLYFPLPHEFVHLLPDHLTDWDCAAASAVNMMCKMLLGSMEQLDKTTQNKTEADIPLDRSHRTSNTSVILSAIIYMCTSQQCFLQKS